MLRSTASTVSAVARTPGQTTWMPPSPIDGLPSDHLVFFLLELEEERDFSRIMGPARLKDDRGKRSLTPGCCGCWWVGLLLAAAWVMPTRIAQENRATVLSIVHWRS